MTTPDGDWIEVRAGDGSVTRRWVPEVERAETSMRSFSEAMARLEAALAALPDILPPPMPEFGVTRGSYGGAWFQRDQRQGEEVYVYDLRPGARVYVLEDVFTVDRVDMDAPLPTVWLKELPTSPLYFTEDEYIYLANETED
jgi:hypothetical protein